jgi:Mrp family chromosome partitioning ATPase
MVERLKEAIEKARRAREAHDGTRGTPAPAPATLVARQSATQAAWDSLPSVTLDPDHLGRHRLVTAAKANAAHLAFDLLRTRLLAKCREMGLRRIAITSPTKGCGKSLVSMNLAFSAGRNPETRTILVDLDLRAPTMAKALGMSLTEGVSDYLSGTASLQAVCHRVAPNLAVCPNLRRVRDSTELLLSERSLKAIGEIDATLAPDLLIYDLPPLFGCDDALAFLPNTDAVIIVARGGQTTAADLEECERLLEGGPIYLGVVLNSAEDADSGAYSAYYGEQEPA